MPAAGPPRPLALRRRAIAVACTLLGLTSPAHGEGGRQKPGKPTARAQAPLSPADAPAVLAAVKRPGARAVLLNVWATWCEPCREEMPDLLRVHARRRARGLRLVLVSADGRDEQAEAEAFLAGLGVDFPSFLKSQDDQAFIDGIDPRWGGTLPATLLYDSDGRVVRLWQKPVTARELEEALAPLLAPRETKPSTRRRQ